MAIPNLLALLLLSKVLIRETNHYLWKGNLDEQMEDLNEVNKSE
jgi:AGCS family alanine or glycine:cation symporter